MSTWIAEWRYRRAVYQGKTLTHPEIENEIRDAAASHKADGQPWLVDGFSGKAADDICAVVRGFGVETDMESFQDLASNLPGPAEVAEAWVEASGRREGYGPMSLELAARALWRIWLPEDPSIETAAEELESGLWSAAKGAEGQATRLKTIQRFIQLVDGEYRVAEALSDELPLRIWPWILDGYRLEECGESSIDEWLQAGDELVPIFPSEAILKAVMARMAAANGQEEIARQAIMSALEGPGIQQGYVLTEVARAYGHLDEVGHAFSFAEKAFVLGEDSDDEQDAVETIRAICSASGLESQVDERILGARKAKADARLAKRRERRKQDRKGKGKRRR